MARMIPCSTPTPTTTTAVTRATANSSLRSAGSRACRERSTSLRPIRKTTAASTALGRYSGAWSGGGARSRRRPPSSAARPAYGFRLSTIAVFVGLPLTTNVPLSPARDVREAEAEEVELSSKPLVVLDCVGTRGGCALREDHEEQRRRDREQRGGVAQVTPCGTPMCGRPLGTGPRVETPWAGSRRPTRGDHPDHGDEAAGNLLHVAGEADEDREHAADTRSSATRRPRCARA